MFLLFYGKWAWHLPDALGSVRQQTDADGLVRMARGYLPFGEGLWEAGEAIGSFGFAGEQEDPAGGLAYLRSRYYDAATGRFISRDRYPATAAIPQSLHRYAYTGNDPVNRTDPSGESWSDAFANVPHEVARRPQPKPRMRMKRGLSSWLKSLTPEEQMYYKQMQEEIDRLQRSIDANQDFPEYVAELKAQLKALTDPSSYQEPDTGQARRPAEAGGGLDKSRPPAEAGGGLDKSRPPENDLGSSSGQLDRRVLGYRNVPMPDGLTGRVAVFEGDPIDLDAYYFAPIDALGIYDWSKTRGANGQTLYRPQMNAGWRDYLRGLIDPETARKIAVDQSQDLANLFRGLSEGAGALGDWSQDALLAVNRKVREIAADPGQVASDVAQTTMAVGRGAWQALGNADTYLQQKVREYGADARHTLRLFTQGNFEAVLQTKTTRTALGIGVIGGVMIASGGMALPAILGGVGFGGIFGYGAQVVGNYQSGLRGEQAWTKISADEFFSSMFMGAIGGAAGEAVTMAGIGIFGKGIQASFGKVFGLEMAGNMAGDVAMNLVSGQAALQGFDNPWQWGMNLATSGMAAHARVRAYNAELAKNALVETRAAQRQSPRQLPATTRALPESVEGGHYYPERSAIIMPDGTELPYDIRGIRDVTPTAETAGLSADGTIFDPRMARQSEMALHENVPPTQSKRGAGSDSMERGGIGNGGGFDDGTGSVGMGDSLPKPSRKFPLFKDESTLMGNESPLDDEATLAWMLQNDERILEQTRSMDAATRVKLPEAHPWVRVNTPVNCYWVAASAGIAPEMKGVPRMVLHIENTLGNGEHAFLVYLSHDGIPMVVDNTRILGGVAFSPEGPIPYNQYIQNVERLTQYKTWEDADVAFHAGEITREDLRRIVAPFPKKGIHNKGTVQIWEGLKDGLQ